MTNRNVTVRLVDVDADNWRDVANVAAKPSQAQFVAATTYYLCLCHYGDDWHPLAIEHDGEVVGHVMWGFDASDGSVWIGGLVIDADSQGRGLGRATMMALVDRFTIDGRLDVALTYSPDNEVARSLYADLGFVETGEMDDDEIVARLRRG